MQATQTLPNPEPMTYEKMCTILDTNKLDELSAWLEIKENVNVLFNSKYGSFTLFHLAIASGNLAAARIMKEKGCTLAIDEDNARLDPPMHWAAIYNRPDFIEFLANEMGVNVNMVNSEGTTALLRAAELGSLEAAKKLKELGAYYKNDRNYIYTPIQIAAKNNHPKLIKFFVNEMKQDANEPQARYKKSPLHLTAQNGSLEAAKMLKKLGAVFSLNPATGKTPLHCAAVANQAHMVRFFVKEMSADVDCRDLPFAYIYSYMKEAIENNSINVVDELLHLKATINLDHLKAALAYRVFASTFNYILMKVAPSQSITDEEYVHILGRAYDCNNKTNIEDIKFLTLVSACHVNADKALRTICNDYYDPQPDFINTISSLGRELREFMRLRSTDFSEVLKVIAAHKQLHNVVKNRFELARLPADIEDHILTFLIPTKTKVLPHHLLEASRPSEPLPVNISELNHYATYQTRFFHRLNMQTKPVKVIALGNGKRQRGTDEDKACSSPSSPKIG